MGHSEDPAPLTSSASTVAAATSSLSFRQVSAGTGAHSCGVTADNRVYCWGFGAFGELGDGTTTMRVTPVPVAGGLQFQTVSAGNSHTCGVAIDQRAYCWGVNQNGRLGDGTGTGRMTPVLVNTPLRFRQVSAGAFHTCGVTTGKRLYCWGENTYGQLGDGTTTHRLSPVAVSTRGRFRQVSAGGGHTCAVTMSHKAFCWGSNSSGKLGDGSTIETRLSPVAVAGGLHFQHVSAGYYQSCGLTTGARTFCWGYGLLGAIGDGQRLDRSTPTAVAGGLSFTGLSVGVYHVCAQTTDQRGYCWGYNGGGELGDGNVGNVSTEPAAIATDLRFTQVSAGSLHSCGQTEVGQAYCWGDNWAGQLGDGTTVRRLQPVAVGGGAT
jgi:alpha-tubulin suppressor-like RCC1 family protein